MENYTIRPINEELLFSHYRVTTNKYGEEIRVPVLDVRDGSSIRGAIKVMTKSSNRMRGSQFFNNRFKNQL